MPAIDIPDPLPPAITPPRTVIEFLVDQDLEEFGDTGLVARTWHWVLHGGGPGPISHMDWSQFDGDGPPSAATLAAESTADEPPLHPPTPWPELNKARFICWLCISIPETKYHYGSAAGTCRHLPSRKTDRSPSPCARFPISRQPGRGDGEGLSIRSLPTPVVPCRASSSSIITSFLITLKISL
jgi:hypothetical protein